MKIINGFDLMHYALKKHYLLPSLNTTNLELTYGIVKGLCAAKVPGYVAISSNNLQLSSPHVIASITKDALKTNDDTPIALHLDHGHSFEDVKKCIEAGFTSIMIDASHLPFEENIKEVYKTTEYCHFYGIPVEAELGSLQGKEDDLATEGSLKTNPDMVHDFVRQTNCDLLAVSVGNVHGLSIPTKIDVNLMEKVSEASPVPLVLHGGVGIKLDILRQIKKYNLLKINYAVNQRAVFIKTFGEAYMKNPNTHNLMGLSMKAINNVSDTLSKLATTINE